MTNGGEIQLEINGVAVSVPDGANVAAAVARATPAFRRGTRGDIRGPLCGMGVCFECRVTVDGQPHARSCQIAVREGMEIRTS